MAVQIEKGALKIEDSQAGRLKDWAAKQKDRWVVLTIRPKRDSRTIPQNSYYWAAVVGPLADHLGEDIDSMHIILKQNFLPTIRRDGLEITLSTTELSTTEFSEYVERIRAWAWSFLEFRIETPEDALNY